MTAQALWSWWCYSVLIVIHFFVFMYCRLHNFTCSPGRNWFNSSFQGNLYPIPQIHLLYTWQETWGLQHGCRYSLYVPVSITEDGCDLWALKIWCCRSTWRMLVYISLFGPRFFMYSLLSYVGQLQLVSNRGIWGLLFLYPVKKRYEL